MDAPGASQMLEILEGPTANPRPVLVASSLTLPALGPGITLFRRPALSLLVGTANPEDAKIQTSLQSLQRSCGGTVSRAEVASSFGLADVLTSDWPEWLPVNCPG